MQARILSFGRPIICSLAVRAVSARWTEQAASSIAAMAVEMIDRLPNCFLAQFRQRRYHAELTSQLRRRASKKGLPGPRVAALDGRRVDPCRRQARFLRERLSRRRARVRQTAPP